MTTRRRRSLLWLEVTSVPSTPVFDVGDVTRPWTRSSTCGMAKSARSALSRCKVKTITARFVLLIATAAVAPLLIYGFVSVERLREGTSESVEQGKPAVASQVAGAHRSAFENNRRVLGSIALQIEGTHLASGRRSPCFQSRAGLLEFKEITCSMTDGTASPPAGSATPSRCPNSAASASRRLHSAADARQRRASRRP